MRPLAVRPTSHPPAPGQGPQGWGEQGAAPAGGLGGQGRGLADGPFQREAAHYLGYVYFRQVKDSSVKRGYFQKVSLLAALGGTAEGGGWRPSGKTGGLVVPSLRKCALLQPAATGAGRGRGRGRPALREPRPADPSSPGTAPAARLSAPRCWPQGAASHFQD